MASACYYCAGHAHFQCDYILPAPWPTGADGTPQGVCGREICAKHAIPEYERRQENPEGRPEKAAFHLCKEHAQFQVKEK